MPYTLGRPKMNTDNDDKQSDASASQLPDADEMTVCPKCDGLGKIEDGTDDEPDAMDECDQCAGTGYSELNPEAT